jgi:putative ATP-dependent endonuclease of OLD family
MTDIAEISLKGFRNFKSARIAVTHKTLIIGANDVGKTNLMYALRLLLDRNLSEVDLDPSDSDFYALEETNEFEITIKFVNVIEDCVLSKMKGYVSDEGELFLTYRAKRDAISRQKIYSLHAGHKLDDLRDLQARHYTRVLNLRYIAGRRDLYSFLKRERRELLEEARTARSDAEKETDAILHKKISSGLSDVSKSVSELTYVKSATTDLNSELTKLSYYNSTHEVVFDAAPFDPSEYVGSVDLVCKVQGRNIPLTGDGRANQVHFSLWAARNRPLEPADMMEVSILCIEEPEAHLHPHQQRKLSSYLFDKFSSQVIVTSHSAQIACEFAPGSIARLYHTREGSKAAGDGCNPVTEEAVVSFGYRMGLIPAEAIFSSAVLLVEGASEVLLFRTLAKVIGIDLDRMNISILSVDGVGFRIYAALLCSLAIPFAIRTDNDIVRIRKSKPAKYRMAGMERAWNLCSEYYSEFDQSNPYLQRKSELTNLRSQSQSSELTELTGNLRKLFTEYGVFISTIDLEVDLCKALPEDLADHYGLNSGAHKEIIKAMKKSKAEGMFNFVRNHTDALKKLAEHSIAQPLSWLKSLLEKNHQ